MQVRTRFAPSPTGWLHVGGVRTALYSWLYARHHHGQFLLRIEDTDQERSTQASTDAILDAMAWLGLNYDAPVVMQSERYSRYLMIIEQLLHEGKAYRCTCSPERLSELREQQLAAKLKPRYDGYCSTLDIQPSAGPCVVRFRNPPEGCVVFEDAVYGLITVDNQELDDLIILRSDGHPTYNFAAVIDDWDMQITHVIRGDDHLNNTPRQINLYQALQAPLPVFAHLPMILGADGKRLSKRHGAVSVLAFKEAGFLPHALLNYLLRLGWSHGDREVFSISEMVAEFDLNAVNRGVAGFNYDKLLWLNQHYIKQDPVAAVAKALAVFFKERGVDIATGPSLEAVVALQADRCKTLLEMYEKSVYFYEDTLSYDPAALTQHLGPSARELLGVLRARLAAIEDWRAEVLHDCLSGLVKERALGFGLIAQPLRVAMTGSTASPAIDKVLALIGKARVLVRLDRALAEEEGLS